MRASVELVVDPLLKADLLEMAQACELIALSSEGLAQRLYEMLNQIPGDEPVRAALLQELED